MSDAAFLYDFLLLAVRTEVSAALGDRDPLDRCPAAGTGFAGPLIYAELILKMSAFISPVKAGPVLLDRM